MRKIVVMALTLGLLLASFYYKPVPVARANGCISPPSGMISWWAGDGAANDQMGINPGTMMNGATFASGMVGQAFSLNSDNDYVEVPDSSNLNPSRMSIDFWYWASNTSDRVFIEKRIASNVGGFYIKGSATSSDIEGWFYMLYGGYWCGTGASHAVHPSYNQWHHVVSLFNGNEVKVYIDGQLDASAYCGSGTLSINPTTAPLRIGKSNTASLSIIGMLDEVELFNRALSAPEIASIYNAGSAGKCKSCVSPPSNMVSWWPGDGNANDIIDSNPGTLMNGATYGTGMVGQAFSLDGVDDYIDAGSNPVFDFGTQNFTIDFWVKFNDTSGEQVLIEKFITGAGPGWTFTKLGSNSLQFYGSGCGGACVQYNSTSIVANTWYHLAITRNSDIFTIYMNGDAKVSMSNPGGNFATTNPLLIGRRNPTGQSYFLNGLIDEIEIFNRALSSTEIASIYNAGSAGKCKTPQCVTPPANMVSWWPGDGHPNDIQDSNHGTLMNGATYGTGMVGQAFSFDGLNDYISVANSTSLKPAQFTIDTWVRATSFSTGNYNSVVSYGSLAGVENPYYIGLAAGIPAFITQHVSGQHNLSAPSSITLNVWHHIAVSFDGVTKSMYLDGSLVASAGIASPIAYGTNAPLLIGEDLDGGAAAGIPFSGLIDEVEIFNRALSAPEIASIYSAGSAGKCKTAQCVTPPANMVSWWPGDGNANDIQDSNHGTLVNGTTYGAGMVSQAFSLDGTNDYVSIPDGILPTTQRYFTLDAWVYPNDTNDRIVFYAGASMGEYQIDIWGGTFRFSVKLTDGNWYDATFAASSGRWVHLVGVRRNTTIELWVDGVLRTTLNVPALDLYITSGYHSSIGAYNRGARFWNGLIDEVELFNRDLSLAEIQSIYNAGSAGKCKPQQTLTVTKTGTGSGTVTSNPTGIDCGSTCSYAFNYNTDVTLSALAGTGSTFVGWSGEGCSGTGTCTVDMTQARNVTATFTINTYAVTANANGNGTGTVSSNVGGINYNYPANNNGTTSSLNYGTNVVLTAAAGTGSTASWNDCVVAGGTVAGNGTATATCTFGSLDNNKTVMATFTLNTYTLTVNINPPGGGTVTGTGINCPGDCTDTVNYNTSIVLTATPTTGYTFIDWTGCDAPSGNTCTMVMTSDKTVTANFTLSVKKKTVLPSMLPLVQNNITKGNEFLKQAQDLLSQAQAKNLDTGNCEKLINEAKELIDKSMATKTNTIYANNLALQAITKLKDAIDCLKALMG